MKNKTQSLFFFLIASLFCANAALAGSATVSWTANTESDLAGYKIYYGTSSRTGTDPKTCANCGYSTIYDAGKVTSYTFNNLTNGATYYFSVSAYDTSNNLSTFSSPEVSKVIPATTAKPGDANGDNAVNIFDYNILIANYGKSVCGVASGDFDASCTINIFDYNILIANYGK